MQIYTSSLISVETGIFPLSRGNDEKCPPSTQGSSLPKYKLFMIQLVGCNKLINSVGEYKLINSIERKLATNKT